MYEEYFGLERPPFKITPDTSLFYEGGKRGDILAALVYAIHRGEGIIKVVGEVGSGKTMLCRMLQLKLPATVEIVYIANPSVSAEDILFVVAHELSLPVAKDASKHEVMHMLQDYLLQRHVENKQVVLFVEEAQGMPLDTLEEIRLLSNLETDEHKLLQIVLFGQPELDQNLAQRSIRQLRERITHNFDLEPLTQDEIHTYLNFRMRQVGYTGPELINSSVAKRIEQHSEGLLRRINIIADKILLSAFAEGTHNLGPKHVSAAVNDSAFSQQAPRKSGMLWWMLLLGAVILALGLYQTRAQWLAMAGVVQLPDSAVVMATENDTPSPEIEVAEQPAVDTAMVATGERATSPAVPVAEPAAAAPTEAVLEINDSSEPADNPAGMIDGSEPAVSSNEPTGSSESVESLAQQTDELALDIEVVTQQVQAALQAESATTQAAAQSSVSPSATLTFAEAGSAESSAEKLSTEKSSAQTPAESLQMAALEAQDERVEIMIEALPDYRQWLDEKLDLSQRWLNADERLKLSIQVMMRSTSAAQELVYYLRNEWPLDISETYLYEVSIDGRRIYRVFYSEYESLDQARAQINLLPESVKVNSPYVHSVERMRKALL